MAKRIILHCPYLLDGKGGKETRLCNWGRDGLGMTEAGEPIWQDQLAQMNAHLIAIHNDFRYADEARDDRAFLRSTTPKIFR